MEEELRDVIKEKEEEKAQLMKTCDEQRVEIKKSKEILSIPRHHMQHLKEHGALEVFVDAHLSGDEKLAKWHLLQAGKKEIN